MDQKTNYIWTNFYDKYLGKDLTPLPTQAINLFYFIDMTYYVLNGGASGFMYNMSPTSTHENLYKPYTNSLEFFNFKITAQMINEYNIRYHKALSQWKLNNHNIFDLYYNQEIPKQFNTELHSQIDKVVASETSIHKWIDQNKNELIQIIE